MKFAFESCLIYYLTFTSSFPAMHLGSELKIYNLAGKIVSLFNFELLCSAWDNSYPTCPHPKNKEWNNK